MEYPSNTTKLKAASELQACHLTSVTLTRTGTSVLEFQKEKTFICVSENGVAFRNTAIYEDRYNNSTYPRVNKPNHPLEVVMGDGKL